MASERRLEDCEEELKGLLEQLRGMITYQLPRKDGDDRRRTLQLTERRLGEAENLLQNFQTELRKVPRPLHKQSARVTQYKAELASLRRQLRSSNVMRDELFSKQDEEEEDDLEDPHRSERQLLLKNTETLRRSSDSLQRAQQVSAQSDDLADGIMVDLEDQKRSLLKTRDRVHGIDSEMNRTTSLLRTLFCKTIENRIILIIVIIVEVLILIAAAYIKFGLKVY